MYKLFLKTGKCMNILTRLQVSSFLFVLTVTERVYWSQNYRSIILNSGSFFAAAFLGGR